MRAAHPCHVSDCTAAATDRCFECGAWCCDEHRSTIQLPTHTTLLREVLCAACLAPHLEAPDRYGRIAIEPLAAGMDNFSVADIGLGL